MEKATCSRPTWSLLSLLSELLSSLLFVVQSSRGSSKGGEDPYRHRAQSCGGPPDLVHPYTLSSSVSCNSSIPSVHSFNKIDCFVCSFCFRFIGSIELQIGRRLYLQGLRDSDSHGCDVGSSSSLLKNFHEMDSSSEDEDQGTHQCGSGSSKDKISLPEGVVESLMNGQLNFPFSKEFSLPSAVRCLGGCGEAYYCRKQTQPTVKQEKFCNYACVERFLKQKGDNVKRAAKQLKSCLSWRDSIGTDTYYSLFSANYKAS
ncbi:hypothetical protein HN51_005340 [Arachis hypogaea]